MVREYDRVEGIGLESNGISENLATVGRVEES